MFKFILLLNLLIGSVFQSYNMVYFYKIIPSHHPLFHTDFKYDEYEKCPPFIREGILYQGLDNGTILAQHIKTKKVLWEYRLKDIPTGSVAVNNIFIITTLKGSIYAFNMHNGNLLWFYDTHKEIISKPAIKDETLYIQTTLDTLYAFNVKDGSLIWQYTSKEVFEGLTVHLVPSPYISKNVLFTGFTNGDAVAIDSKTGKIIWTHKPPTMKQLQDITIQPAGNSQIVVFASYDNGLMCLNKKDGTVVWERNDLKRALGMYLSDNALYVVLVDGKAYRLDIRTGDTIWKNELLGNSNLFTPLMYNQVIAIGVKQAKYKGIVLISKDDGHIIHHFPIVSGLSAEPIIHDNRIYAISNGGFLYCFE